MPDKRFLRDWLAGGFRLDENREHQISWTETRRFEPRVERLNGEIRDREILMRGLDHDEAAQIIADGLRINHNFIRPNIALDGKTPAEACGVRVEGEKQMENDNRKC